MVSRNLVLKSFVFMYLKFIFFHLDLIIGGSNKKIGGPAGGSSSSKKRAGITDGSASKKKKSNDVTRLYGVSNSARKS
jgi:hypothetical protein